LAFLTVLVRSLLRSVAVETTVWQAVAAMFVFAAIGGLIGQIAGWIVDESVRGRLAAEIAAHAKSSSQAAAVGQAKV
jgi:hypothetical protein